MSAPEPQLDERGVDRAARRLQLGPVFGRLVHDLAQPLNQIRMVSQELGIDLRKDRFDPASLPDCLQEIEAAVAVLDTRLRQLGSLRDAAAETVASGPVPVQLETLCRRLGARLGRCFEGATVDFEFDSGARLELLRPDAFELSLWELLINAAEAASLATGRPPELRLRLSRSERGSVLALEDAGDGFSAAEVATQPQPFHSSRPGAAGLGLWLAAELLAREGARLECVVAEDAAAGGGEVRVHLPAAPPADAAGG
ncbi:MAG: hypothetical protein OEZ06_14795 [Myxococcales bacterium]|nr:hypothetical protein [Myxococcales bacterium]